MPVKNYSAITPEIYKLSELCINNNQIEPQLYMQHDVKRGLRDNDGKGVLTGLTEVSTINSKKLVDGQLVPSDGELYYRGINVEDLVEGFTSEGRFGYEETVYLLLFGKLPNKQELDDFVNLFNMYRTLPRNFTRDVIMKAPNQDIMNVMARSVLTLYAYDKNANDTSIPNVLRQSIQLISNFPVLSVYAYRAYRHFVKGKGLILHSPSSKLSTAENILRLLRPDKSFTALEAKILDIALVLHAEHGGGNNSTFTTHVVTSSGTDTYSAISAAVGALKGFKHGGANIKVTEMLEDIKAGVSDWKDDEEVLDYLKAIIRKDKGNGSGLIYGMGHAVYTISDPRAVILKDCASKLAEKKNMLDEFKLIESVERLTPVAFSQVKNSDKPLCANIDLYSGFVYDMLNLPRELFTPIFATARIAGWCAHRIEEITVSNRIIRPAYKAILNKTSYLPLSER